MKLINQTKNTIISEDVAVAHTLLTRTKGLLGRNQMRQGEALVITACNSIHTFFMRFPIDVLFVDKKDTIVLSAPGIRPFRLKAALTSSYVIELPTGTIARTRCSAGDKITLE